LRVLRASAVVTSVGVGTVLVTARRFLEVEMPARFVLEVETSSGSWIDYGLFAAETFARLEDGAYVCAGHGGSPLLLRCVAESDGVLECLDGAGQPVRYRLAPAE
jgi:hypothetical protein